VLRDDRVAAATLTGSEGELAAHGIREFTTRHASQCARKIAVMSSSPCPAFDAATR
jgi:hypothetical protein